MLASVVRAAIILIPKRAQMASFDASIRATALAIQAPSIATTIRKSATTVSRCVMLEITITSLIFRICSLATILPSLFVRTILFVTPSMPVDHAV